MKVALRSLSRRLSRLEAARPAHPSDDDDTYQCMSSDERALAYIALTRCLGAPTDRPLCDEWRFETNVVMHEARSEILSASLDVAHSIASALLTRAYQRLIGTRNDAPMYPNGGGIGSALEPSFSPEAWTETKALSEAIRDGLVGDDVATFKKSRG